MALLVGMVEGIGKVDMNIHETNCRFMVMRDPQPGIIRLGLGWNVRFEPDRIVVNDRALIVLAGQALLRGEL